MIVNGITMRTEKTEKICRDIIDYLIRDGYVLEVPKHEVRKAIRIYRGIDPRTVKNWTQILEDLEYLIPKRGGIVYKINPFKCPQVISKLKEKPQAKLQ